MSEPTRDDLTAKAEAAFRQAARKVIQTAKQTGTPVIVWQSGKVLEISPDRLDEGHSSPNTTRPSQR